MPQKFVPSIACLVILFVAVTASDARDDSPGSFRLLNASERLTLSFAPDGTNILGQPSSLFQSFRGLMTEDQLKEQVVNAFQAWARYGNLTVAIVDDSGDDFGIPGRTFGDPRFGDIRVGAVPLAKDIFAVAMAQSDFVSGTWSGDILFNSNADLTSIDQFYSVALHEAGHVLGLEHSHSANSVMFVGSSRTQLANEDIANFQKLYGRRSLDPNEVEQSNDFRRNATKLSRRFEDQSDLENDSEDDEDRDHQTVTGDAVAAFGDISHPLDKDWYTYEIPEDFSGALEIHVHTEKISVLRPRLLVRDEDKSIFRKVQWNHSSKGDLVAVVPVDGERTEKLFVQVAADDQSTFGCYALLISSQQNSDTETLLEIIERPEYFSLEEQDLVRLLKNPSMFQFEEVDDETPQILEPASGYLTRSRFEYRGTLQTGSDQDSVVITLPESIPETGMLLNLAVRAVDFGSMKPEIAVVDELGIPVAGNTIVNGIGELVFQTAAVTPGSFYTVTISADQRVPWFTGNYELATSFSAAAVTYSPLIESLAPANEVSYHSLHIATSQFLQFAVQADNSQATDATVQVTVYDQNHQVVFRTMAFANELATHDARYLSPGSYLIEVDAMGTGQPLPFWLGAFEAGDGQGAAILDPSDTPFQKTVDGYVYPDDVLSEAEYVVIGGVSSNQRVPVDIAPPPSSLYETYWAVN